MGKNFSLNSNNERPKSDFYQTPYSITRHLLNNEEFKGDILEPCCGEGAIVKVLEENNHNVIFFDKNHNEERFKQDFLKYRERVDNIITNPPYKFAKEFILHSLNIAREKIAMLLPLNYLHGKERYDILYKHKMLEKVYVFTRYPLLSQEIREDGKYKTGMMVYAWYIFNKNYYGDPKIKWIDNNDDILR